MLKPFLMSTETTGLAMNLLGALLSGCARVVSYTGTDYVAPRLDQARLNYRTNAVLGLGAVGDDEALGVLKRVAAGSGSTMRAAAQEALATIQQRGSSGD